MTTPSNQLFKQGQELAQHLFGNTRGDVADTLMLSGDDELPETLVTWLYGYLLKERSQLDVKTKLLCLIAMYTATNQDEMIRRWIPAARNAGCTRLELQETMVTMLVYAGWPAARRALEILASEWTLSTATESTP